jgi:hypothetical protein
MKAVTMLALLLLATMAAPVSHPNDYSITVHVTSSQFVGRSQDLDVVIDGQQNELVGVATRNGLLVVGEYNARLTRDEHKSPWP